MMSVPRPPKLGVGPDDALVLVDVQNDFLPGGNLAVPRGDAIVPALNHAIAVFAASARPVFATRDWHPPDHCSFRAQGGRWPPHCIKGSWGARFAPGLALPASTTVISKATTPEREAYSGFERTDLAERLRATGAQRLFVGGLATEHCVLATVRDALELGFEVRLLLDGIGAMDAAAGAQAIDEMVRRGAVLIEAGDEKPGAHAPPTSTDSGGGALLTDLYQLTMLHGYFEREMFDTAVFELFVRRLPRTRNFLVAAGLEQVLDYLEGLRFAPWELDWLMRSGQFPTAFLDWLADLRFTGDVDAMPEGTVCFADEPLVRVTAPLPEAQLVETRLMNLVHFQTLVASKAARCVLAAPGKALVEFGLRRAHGAEAGLFAARAAWIAGFTGTSNVLAGARFGIPTLGTLAHSYIEAHDDEADSFLSYARAQRESAALLLDTYDVEAAARHVVALTPQFVREGLRLRSVRLDSGDLAAQARRVRAILDEGGLRDVAIVASGGLDERQIAELRAAPIDGFGVGTRLVTSSDAPALDCAYKLMEYAGRPRRKRSAGKATWPGPKQAYRCRDAAGTPRADEVALVGEPCQGTPLLEPAMRAGRRLRQEPLSAARARAEAELAALPPELRALDRQVAYPVRLSSGLRALAARMNSEDAHGRHQ